MAVFSSKSQQALQRLKAFCARPPPTVYPLIPTKSRAAVLLILFPSRHGDIRVVLTQRSAHMRTFPSQIALPGGKAEEGETAFQTARREAYEEIGLPLSGRGDGWHLEEIGELPCIMSKTVKAVRPCVAVINCEDGLHDVERQLVPVLEERGEVKEVFACNLEDFLGMKDWNGQRSRWNDSEWVMHEFMVPRKVGDGAYRVWGMTAKILVDAARVAYARNPSFDFVQEIGGETMVRWTAASGQFGELRGKL